MLTLSNALNSAQVQQYHELDYASALANYWKQDNTVQGEWQGQLAGKFGLAGAVEAQDFARLSEGQHPRTGDQLVRHRTGEPYTSADGTTVTPAAHRAGWDATFSPPKSVSLTALVGGDDRIRDAHHAAVTTAVAELERYTQARIGGNHPAETTGKFIAAKFEHDTARPVDGYAAPQLHTHVVIFNMTERADGSTRALQERGFFDSQQFATAVYQAELTFQLRNLGYGIEAGKSGAPEIAGYTREYIEASSPRRQQIEEALFKSGYNGPEAAQIAAHNTRDRKEMLTPEAVLTAHRQIAADFGNQADRVVSEARVRAQSQTQDRVPDAPMRAQEAVTYAKNRNFEREAVTEERDLLRDALRRGMGDVTYAQVRTNFDQRHATGELQTVNGAKHETGRQFTTRETIMAEREVIGQMQRGQNTVAPIMTGEQAAVQASTREFLNPTQRKAIEEVLTSPHRVHGFEGLAGTGKTTTLEVIREGAERHGYIVEGFAPTGRAAEQLREAGIAAGTLQGYLARPRPADEPPVGHLYLVDESSLASTRQMRDFLEKIDPQDRVLLIGDTHQHQGVDAGKPFEQLQRAGMHTAQLDTIVRQKDPELLRAVEHLSKGEVAIGIDLLNRQGRITEVPDRTERFQAIAKDYATKPEGTLVVSPDNRSRREINDAIRAELQRGGTVSKEEHTFTVLTPRSDMTGADRAWAAKYQPSDILFYNRGSKEPAIERGSYAIVLSVDAARNHVTVARQDGQQVTYDPRRLQGIAAYNETGRSFAVGDRLQFTAPIADLKINNRELGRIDSIEANRITVRVDGAKERTISFDPSTARHFDHGYAVTSHSSQGLTATRVLINVDTTVHPELLNTRFAYVSVSRAAQDARIYTDDAAALGKRLGTDISKSSALETSNPEARHANTQKEPTMNKTAQNATGEVVRHPHTETRTLPTEKAQATSMDENGPPYAPLHKAVPGETYGYEWKRATGDIQSYRHNVTTGWLHIDPQGQFHNRQSQPITRERALETAGHCPAYTLDPSLSQNQQALANLRGISR